MYIYICKYIYIYIHSTSKQKKKGYKTVSNLFWDSLLYSTDWLLHDVGSEREESWNRLLTVLYPFFSCLLVLYFYIAPSRVLFEYLSCKLCGWYLLILIGLLTCIQRIFKFNFLLYLLLLFYFELSLSVLFWSYLGRYSFYTFCLMYSLRFLNKPKYKWIYINIKKCTFQ